MFYLSTKGKRKKDLQSECKSFKVNWLLIYIKSNVGKTIFTPILFQHLWQCWLWINITGLSPFLWGANSFHQLYFTISCKNVDQTKVFLWHYYTESNRTRWKMCRYKHNNKSCLFYINVEKMVSMSEILVCLRPFY